VASSDYSVAYVRLSPRAFGLLYSPTTRGAESRTGLVVSHPNSNYLNHLGGAELATRGFRVLCVNGRYVNTRRENMMWEQVPLDIAPAISHLRGLAELRNVVLVGHSGGGQLMPFYQNVAENGLESLRSLGRFVQPDPGLAELPPADGLILLDPHHGYSANTLTSLDPSVLDESQPATIGPELDVFNPSNGYDSNHPSYTAEFTRRYFRVQAERMNRLNTRALERLAAIQRGKGLYPDDEPFPVARTQARIWQLDTTMVSRTRGAYAVLRANGASSVEVARSVRVAGVTRGSAGAAAMSAAENASYHAGAVMYTVKSWLSSNAIDVDPAEYAVTEDDIRGIDWTSSATSTPANLAASHVPLLILAMTGHYWMVPSEIFYTAAAATDKELVFVEGASHNLVPCRACEHYPGEYGDTVRTIFDHVAAWLRARYS
jgi:pimeloyl-ACP methyl ester carboxylesterase